MRLLTSLTAVVFAAAGVAAPPPKADEKKSNKELIVGTWELVKTSQEGGVGGRVLHLEFTKEGKMIMRDVDGKEKTLVYEAKYKVEGEKEDKLPYESITEGVDKKETLKIKKMTEDEMVFEDDDGIVEEFKRVKEKKDEKKGEEKKG
jgi:uncharacterized protein (TIGR03066 family)